VGSREVGNVIMAAVDKVQEELECSDSFDGGDGKAPLLKHESKTYGSDGDLQVPISPASFCSNWRLCLSVCVRVAV